MSIKKSVMLTNQSEKMIRDCCRDPDNILWSQNINNNMDCLQTIYIDLLSRIDLSTDQWQVILSTYNSHHFEYNSFCRIASDIMDDLGCLDVNELAEPAKSTVLKTYKMTKSQQLAVLNVVQRFWSMEIKSGSLDDIIKSLTEYH